MGGWAAAGGGGGCEASQGSMRCAEANLWKSLHETKGAKEKCELGESRGSEVTGGGRPEA